VLRWLLEPMG